MKLDISRAHGRFLGLTGIYHAPRDEELASIGRVEVTLPARAALKAHLDVPGQHRGGPLLGYRRDGVIIVLYAVSSGYTCWHQEDRSPLQVNEPYLLGWIDCLRAQADTPLPVDWVGHWLAYPDSHLGDRLGEDLAWIQEASRTALIDERNCLLIVGWEDQDLGTRAYAKYLQTGAIMTLNHNLTGSQLT